MAALRKQYFDKNDVKISTNSKKCGAKFGKQNGVCVRSSGGVMPNNSKHNEKQTIVNKQT